MFIPLMSIAGLVPILFYKLYEALSKSLKTPFHLAFGKKLIFLVCFFFIFPIQTLKGLLPLEYYQKLSYFASNKQKTIISTDSYSEIHIAGEYVWLPKWITYVIFIWLIVVFTFAIYQIIHYQYLIRFIKKNTAENEIMLNNKKIKLYISDKIYSPYTVGFFRPVIFFPEMELPVELRNSLLQHEYCHIKNHDSLMKLLLLVICCIHWYNPLVWILIPVYSHLCEYIADEYAVQDLSLGAKKNISG
jgi:beta-lactamase regulating signal transducer with metallopeptidase domain